MVGAKPHWRRAGSVGWSRPGERVARFRDVAAALLLVVAAAGLGACGSAPPGEPQSGDSTATSGVIVGGTGSPGASPEEVVVARDRAAENLAEQFGQIDPVHLSGIDYLHRNWDIAQLQDAGTLAVEQLQLVRNSSPTVTPPPEWWLADGDVLEFARYVDPEAPRVTVSQSSADPVTVMLVAALHCDRQPLGGNDLEVWRELASAGGYESTHVLMAGATARELGCSSPEMEGIVDDAVAQVVADVATRSEGGISAARVDDLFLEQAAFLLWVGGPNVLAGEWLSAVLEAQLPDGGWPREQGEVTSDWHATALGVWALSASLSPGNGARWTVP